MFPEACSMPGGVVQRVSRPSLVRKLTERIRKVHQASRRTYGSPRVHAELIAQGHSCNRKTVTRCMREAGIQARSHRRFRVTTTDSSHGHPVAPNIVDRNFQPSGENRIWVADITYVATEEGWLYLAAAEDLFTLQIVGWSMLDRIDSRLVVDAGHASLSRSGSDRPLRRRRPICQRALSTAAQGARHHLFDELSWKLLWQCPMESFFATLKKELVHHERYQSRQSVFQCIEVFYNRVRRHSALKYQSPAQLADAT